MWRAGLDYSSHWEIRLSLCRAELTCGGLGETLVALGASAVTVCRAVCHEGLKETGGRRMRRSGFDIEF